MLRCCHALIVLALLTLILIPVSAAGGQDDAQTHVFFGFVFADPFCDHNTGHGLPGVLVTLFNADWTVHGTDVSHADPPDMLGYYQIAGIVPGQLYNYRFELQGYVTIEGSFTAVDHDYKLRPCMEEEPLPIDASSWGAVKAIYRD